MVTGLRRKYLTPAWRQARIFSREAIALQITTFASGHALSSAVAAVTPSVLGRMMSKMISVGRWAAYSSSAPSAVPASPTTSNPALFKPRLNSARLVAESSITIAVSDMRYPFATHQGATQFSASCLPPEFLSKPVNSQEATRWRRMADIRSLAMAPWRRHHGRSLEAGYKHRAVSSGQE